MDDKIKNALNSDFTNLSLTLLPREREDLWFIDFIPGFNAFIVGAYFDMNDGLYIKYSKRPTYTLDKESSLRHIHEVPFSENTFNQALAELEIRRDIMVMLYGTDAYGAPVSELTVNCKPEHTFVVNDSDEFVIKLIPISNELIEFDNTKTIKLSGEDYAFLKELQHELNTQTSDGNADPVYWGVMETVEQMVPEDCGSDIRIAYDCDSWTLEEFVQHVGECIDTNEDQDKWDAVDKEDAQEVVDFVNDNWNYNADVYEIRKEERLSHTTGAFLTKRACKEYIEKYNYNHSNPKTYAMTAYRNFELEKLLRILKTMKLE